MLVMRFLWTICITLLASASAPHSFTSMFAMATKCIDPAVAMSRVTENVGSALHESNAPPGCTNCTKSQSRSRHEYWVKEMLRRTILKQLDMDSSPSTYVPSDEIINLPICNTSKPMVRLRQQEPLYSRTTYRAGDDKLIPCTSGKPDGGKRKKIVQFDIPQMTINQKLFKIHSVDVWVLLKKRGKKRKSKRITLRISIADESGKRKKSIASLRTKVQRTFWYKIGLPLNVLQNNKSLLLHITCRKCKKRVRPILCSQKTGKERATRRSSLRRQQRRSKATKRRRKGIMKKTPFLIIHTQARSARPRRHVSRCQRDVSNTTNCCRLEMFINFREIQWSNWIVSPVGYMYSECIGVCGSARSNSRESRSVEHLAITDSGNSSTERNTSVSSERERNKRKRRRKRRRRRTCKPSKSRPLRLIYFNENMDIKTKDLPNMIVKECGCKRSSRLDKSQ